MCDSDNKNYMRQFDVGDYFYYLPPTSQAAIEYNKYLKQYVDTLKQLIHSIEDIGKISEECDDSLRSFECFFDNDDGEDNES